MAVFMTRCGSNERFRLLVAAISLAFCFAETSPSSQQQAPPRPYRTGVVAVPLDVRAMGNDGTPVTDLAREDFTVFEDGIRQEIVTFDHHGLSPTLKAQPPSDWGTSVSESGTTVPDRRIFLIVIGSGAFAGPFNPRQVLVAFLRQSLLPDDEVALCDDSKATEFTTNHNGLANVIAGRAKQDESSDVKAVAAQEATGRARITGFLDYLFGLGGPSTDLANLQHAIGFLKTVEGEKHIIWVTRYGELWGPPTTAAGPAWVDRTSLARSASDSRVALHVIQSGGMGLGGTVATGYAAPGPPPGMSDDGLPLPFIGNILPSVPRSSAFLPGAPRPAAVDVRRDPETGTLTPLIDGAVLPPLGTPLRPAPVPGFSGDGLIALAGLRTLSGVTGGQASIMESPEKAMQRIEQFTRAGYHLAYYPTNASLDGRFRRIEVKVARQGVVAFYRRGYFAPKGP